MLFRMVQLISEDKVLDTRLVDDLMNPLVKNKVSKKEDILDYISVTAKEQRKKHNRASELRKFCFGVT
jgi:hypothetical protein